MRLCAKGKAISVKFDNDYIERKKKGVGIFSKKPNSELLELLEADAKREAENESVNTPHDKIQPSHMLTVDEFSDNNKPKQNNTLTDSPLESLKKRVLNMSTQHNDTTIEEPVKKEKKPSTLLQKCKPYTVDEAGRDATTPKAPLYRLETVAEILENDSRRAMDRLSEKYDIMIDDLGYNKVPKKEVPPAIKIQSTNNDDSDLNSNVKVNNVQTSLPNFSDIDTLVVPKPEIAKENEGATIRFTPIKDEENNKTVTSVTNTIDLTNELSDLLVPDSVTQEKTQLEETEFEEFVSSDEINSPADAKKLIYKLSVKKRNSFLKLTASIFLSLILLIFEIPSLSSLMLSQTEIMMGICTGILVLITLINCDMFLSLKNIISRKSDADVTASLAALSSVAYCICATVFSKGGYEMAFLCGIVLSVRAIAQFMSRSALLGNLKQIATLDNKKAVSLIMDEATTFAMARDAIEGDVLVAAPRQTKVINDFMKYSKFGLFINGKLPIITVSSLILAIVSAFASVSIFDRVYEGFYAFAAVMCIAALPTLFLVEALPIFDTAKKLNPKGAMIAGKTAAERLYMANAIVLTCEDLFPSGSVTLHDMKVLSDNSIDDTILRAASLTDAINSPLATIFKQIAGTNSAYDIPDSDTVKYEDRLGVSGWVDDELLFIGNRTLMESHGIEVPDVKIDKKILSRGFFPVYIANGNTAVALLIVQYSANERVALELKRITDSGVTLLINNCDPNITAEMICDYLGLYDDTVRIMSNAGVHMYKNANEPTESCSAPASFKGRGLNFVSVINTASKLKKSSILLNVLHILIMCTGFVVFAYLSFSGASAPLSARTLMLCETAAFFASLLIYQAFKP